MPRKKTAVAPPPEAQAQATAEAPPAAPTDQPAEPPPPATTPAPEKKRPTTSWRYPTDRTTTVEVAVWPMTIVVDGRDVEVYSVTIQRSYKDQGGSWQKNGSYRGHDIPVLIHALLKAHAFILDLEHH